ncbi:MAG: nitroreductase family deazaflavin-dependent oxidoreductase [Acidimicrobiia bacterium]
MARTYHLGAGRRLINAVATPLIRMGLAPRGSHLLTTLGRRTGQRRTNPVHLVDDDGHRYLVAPYGVRPWVLNARAAGTVTLTRGRRSTTYAITELGAADAAPILKRYVEQVPVTRPFFDATKDSPVAAFEAEVPAHPVFRLDPPAY